jgi:hypothetical protein
LVDKILKGIKFSLWYKDPSLFFKDIFNMTPHPYQAKIMRKLNTDPKRMLFMAAGGTGKTKLLAGIALWLTTVYPKYIGRPYTVIIISGSDDQARYLYEYCKYGIADSEILKDEVDGDPMQSLTKFKDRSIIRAVPNSLKAIQGKHEDCVIVDEGALAGDFVIQDTLRIVSSTDRDLIIISGTPTINNVFIEMWEDEKKYDNWERFHWTAADCPSIAKDKLEEAKKLPPEMWSRFWEGLPYGDEGTLVPIEDLKGAMEDKSSYEISGEHDVVAGLDWGWNHATALVIVQKAKDEVYRVLYSEGWKRENFEDVHDKIEVICRNYHVTRIFADGEDIGENQRLEARGLNVVPITFNQNKVQMQTNLRIIFHQKLIKIPETYQVLIQQLRRYNWSTKINDDSVDALQLALWGAKEEINSYYYEVI